MVRIDVTLPIGYTADDIERAAASRIPICADEIRESRIVKRVLDTSDKSNIHYKATLALALSEEREFGLLKMRKTVKTYSEEELVLPESRLPSRPVVVGAGPAGLFCALALAEAGASPILLERGLDVDTRAKRVSTFRTLGVLDTECNVQYGEGGAGTYSDGKLKVGSKDKYKLKILREFVSCGANPEILYNVGAHVGTDKLSGIVKRVREKITALGGEVIFGARVSRIRQKNGKITGISYVQDGKCAEIDTDALVFATGHSARDSFELLRAAGAVMERRGFGIGMRIEHPREYIDRLVYGDTSSELIGTASYHLVAHLPTGRSAYSFCMCPGGEVVAAASEACGIVTNGMSREARGDVNSNSALLVSVTPDDFGSEDIFAGLDLQRRIERAAYLVAGGSYKAPSISLESFLSGGAPYLSEVAPSYAIGTECVRPEEYLPSFVTDSLRAAISDFDAWMPGFNYPAAALTGPETRSTSPIRILRDERTLEALGVCGLWCAGEGAGYAGGIISSARDGLIIAEAILTHFCAE